MKSKKYNYSKRNSKTIKLPKIYKLAFIMASLSAIAWLGSALFLRSYNINLSMKQQEIEQQIDDINVVNDALRVEIQELINRERVVNIAEGDGMQQNQNNIVTIGK